MPAAPEPFDIRELTDQDAIGMVNALRNVEARFMWVMAMTWTTGTEAVPFLRSLFVPGAERQGRVVAEALRTLSNRAPAAALEDATAVLGTRRGFETHMVALDLLMEARRPEGLDPIYDYIARRVSRPRWFMDGGDWEIPSYIRFAAETDTLPRIAQILEIGWRHLDDHEQARVDAAWPTHQRRDTAAGNVHPPRLDELREWERETSFGREDYSDEELRDASVEMLNFWNEPLARSWHRRKHK